MNFSMSVSELNEYVRRSLASDPVLRRLYISGEISNLKRHASGHWYFTLKDEEAAISCVMFRQNNLRVAFVPRDGQKVRLLGSVSLFAKTGSYQFYAELMEQTGMGELYLRLEALKQKLLALGWFDEGLKKPLPLLPAGIGIVTSDTGAVIHDIARVSWRRFPGMPLYLCPVRVQGTGAAEEIAVGIALLDSLPCIDVIIVGRGGGSLEDLWAFNEELVARAIYQCQKPVISAVGHETDFTIADMVADMRAATPSAAAELAVPSRAELLALLNRMEKVVQRGARQAIAEKQYALSNILHRLEAASPAKRVDYLREKTRAAENRVVLAFSKQLETYRHSIDKAEIRIRAAELSASGRLRHLEQRVEAAQNRVKLAFQRQKEAYRHQVEKAEIRVQAAEAGSIERIRRFSEKTETLQNRMRHAYCGKIEEFGHRIDKAEIRIRGTAAENSEKLRYLAAKNEKTKNRIVQALSRQVEQNREAIQKARIRIQAAEPERALRRGYALVMSREGLIRGVQKLQPGQGVRLCMKDGEASAQVQHITLKWPHGEE